MTLKKVYQDKFGLGGNCATAAHATLLGLDLDQVPYYNDGLTDSTLSESDKTKIFYDRIQEFLNPMGLQESCYHYSQELVDELKTLNSNLLYKYYQVIGKSPRGYMHVVIYCDGELYHDPHPDGGGVEETYIALLEKYKGDK